MFFGNELAKGETNLKGKLFYHFLGSSHIGARVRKFYLAKAMKDIKDCETILDAGSGSGCYAFYFSRKFTRSHIVSIDLNGDQISNCQKIQIELNRNNLEFVQGDLRKLAVSERFDLIYSIDVLEHIDEDTKVLRNFNRALKPRGILILHLPRERQLHKFYFKRFQNRLNDGHVRDGYLKNEIVSKLNESNFMIKEFKNTCGKFASLSRELQLLIDEVKWLRPLLKLFTFPFLITLAYLDTTLTLSDKKDHQGFLVTAVKANDKENE